MFGKRQQFRRFNVWVCGVIGVGALGIDTQDPLLMNEVQISDHKQSLSTR